MNRTPPALVWFRHDLRLSDNPALSAAVAHGGPVIPVFIWEPEEERPWDPGEASRWWLHQSLVSLDSQLRAKSSRLVLRRGPTLETLKALIAETGAKAVFWNRRYEPAVRERDENVTSSLKALGIDSASFNASLLHEPWEVQNQTGKPFRVFTAYWRHCLRLPAPTAPLAAPAELSPPHNWPISLPLAGLKLEPTRDWTAGLRAAWQPGEPSALRQAAQFIAARLGDYDENRNRPALTGTSRLSPHLHFGEISPRQLWHRIRQAAEKADRPQSQFIAELGWREFAHHLLHHFPHTPTEPLRPEFAKFRWRRNQAWLEAWQKGRTGYPLVDAGMRELWNTGWMHNRVRMVTASFLVKNLLISWTEGARWFWDTLVDADLAQNTLGWQWSAGCGADAAPFFRIFNPTIQAGKFDPGGVYIRRWIPEISNVSDQWIHRPWEAPAQELNRAGIIAGKTYPLPIVSTAISREVALEAYAKLHGR